MGIVGPDGDAHEAAICQEGWVREWSFFIWTWTITSGRDHWLVETVQHSFLGQEVVRRYSRAHWMLSVWAVVIAAVLISVAYGALVYMTYMDPGVDFSGVALMGLLLLPVVIASAAIAYFTFVPQRGTGPQGRSRPAAAPKGYLPPIGIPHACA